MAVNGACSTPAINPAIPIKVKLVSDTLNPKPKLLIILATTLPNALPITMVGIKIPPAPPAANVVVIAMALNTVIPINNPMTTQILSFKWSKGVVPNAAKWFPANRLFIKPKPSPYNGGIKYNMTPIANPPMINLMSLDLNRSKNFKIKKYILVK